MTHLNKFYLQFINIGFIFLCGFFHRLGLSYWLFSSHRRPFRLSISFIFWMSHWELFSFWINGTPLSVFACYISHIGSLIVNHNRDHFCVITVWQTSRILKVISRNCNKISEGWVIFVSIPHMARKRRGFKEPTVVYWAFLIMIQKIFSVTIISSV